MSAYLTWDEKVDVILPCDFATQHLKMDKVPQKRITKHCMTHFLRRMTMQALLISDGLADDV